MKSNLRKALQQLDAIDGVLSKENYGEKTLKGYLANLRRFISGAQKDFAALKEKARTGSRKRKQAAAN